MSWIVHCSIHATHYKSISPSCDADYTSWIAHCSFHFYLGFSVMMGISYLAFLYISSCPHSVKGAYLFLFTNVYFVFKYLCICNCVFLSFVFCIYVFFFSPYRLSSFWCWLCVLRSRLKLAFAFTAAQSWYLAFTFAFTAAHSWYLAFTFAFTAAQSWYLARPVRPKVVQNSCQLCKFSENIRNCSAIHTKLRSCPCSHLI